MATKRMGAQPKFLKIGHRGYPRVAPGNTMKGFRHAASLGCHWVECDCRPSADGVIMLSHDDSVTDRDGKTWVIDEHPAEALRGLDIGAGEGVPTLVDLVDFALSAGIGVMADMKCSGFEKQVGAQLAPLCRSQKIVPGADEEGRRRFRALYPELPISWSLGADAGDLLDGALINGGTGTDAVTLEHPLATPERLARLHDAGLKVYTWTVDDFETMRRLVDLGVDGVISNRADLLAKL